MVKGVNRTVIEVNNTGSKVFEKIVFYVSPQYGNLSAKVLKRAAGEISLGLNSYPKKKTLRQRMIIRRRVIIASIVTAVLLAAVGIVWLIL
ncbi:MAG: hypothetical protein E7561_03415 [Ruminococcaceae bacterium]|nr:hypothetical protein [Oscillospiraceae bacterium]